MKHFFILFCFSIFIFSCSNNTNSDIKNADFFREDVLKIQRAGLLKSIPSSKIDSLIAIYKTDSLNGLKNLLESQGDLLKIHVSLNGRSLQEVYQKICDTIGRKYPQLKCDEVQTSIIPTDPNGKDTSWVLLRLRFNQTWYERKMYCFAHWEIDDFVYRIYNRMLADSGKQERLHLVEYVCKDCGKGPDDFMGNTDVTQYGYLLLNKAQEDSLVSIERLRMEPEKEFSVFTTKQVEEQLTKFESTGLVGELGEKWYQNAKLNVYQNSIYKMQDIYDIFDTLICTINFDTLVDINPYAEILMDLSKISRGKFNPIAISDEGDNSDLHNVQFTFAEDVYKFSAQTAGGLHFPGIIDNINKALDDHNTGGAFYTILTRENTCLLIYINNSNVEKTKASGFFSEFTKGPSKELKDRWSIPPM